MITCQDILELQLDGVELIAGEEGLARPVTWTYDDKYRGASHYNWNPYDSHIPLIFRTHSLQRKNL